MRSHVARVFMFSALLLLFVGSTRLVYAQGATASKDSTAATSKSETPSKTAGEEASYFTVSGGYSWPVGGPVENTYQAGFTMGAAFRKAVVPSYISGIEFGYTWLTLDSANLASMNPGSTFSGGDMGLLSITTENDYLFGAPEKPMRPFVNLGIGYYKSFIDDATQTTGSNTTSYSTGVYEGSFFGFHAGIGAMINRDRFGLRLDANYQHLFAGGPDLEFFTARGGIVFYTG
jgi:outer membrane protein W